MTESRFDLERRWLSEMEQLGPAAVRTLFREGKPVTTSQAPHPDAAFVASWLARHDRGRVRFLWLLLLISAIVVIAGVLLTMIG